MIELSTDLIPANPPGVDVRLTRDDLWRGLVWKAEVPMLFAAGIVGCTVLERFADGFLREVQVRTPTGGTERAQERIVMAPREAMTFLRLSGSTVGRVVNEIVERPSGRLSVQFHCVLGIVGTAHGSAAEHRRRAGIVETYVSTWEATLAALRERRRTGRDPVAHLLDARAAGYSAGANSGATSNHTW